MKTQRQSEPRPGVETFFVTCAPALEPALHREVRALGLKDVEQQVRGVRFCGAIADAWRANLQLRTGIRVLLRVGRFQAPAEKALYDGVAAVDWRRFLAPAGTLLVSARTRDSRLTHSHYLEQLAKDAIADQFRAPHGVRPTVDKNTPDLLVHLHLFRDRCTLSVDTSGDSLHKRGWRRFQGRAPLAETLAAAMVILSGWDRRTPLVDPFCGSGTILIEAALIAAGVPAGAFRQRFGFERFPGHEAEAWQAMREEARRASTWPAGLVLHGFDRDPKAIAGARENVRAAGLEGRVELAVGDATEVEIPSAGTGEARGWIVANPPYGERVGEESDLVRLYERFGAALRARAGGWRFALLSGNSRLARRLRLGVPRSIRLWNGAIACELLQGSVPEGARPG